MNRRSFVTFSLILAGLISLIAVDDVHGQRGWWRGGRTNTGWFARGRTYRHRHQVRENHATTGETSSSVSPDSMDRTQPRVNQRQSADLYRSTYYKIDAAFDDSTTPHAFSQTGTQWDQPGGPGSPITITYSYGNLLDGTINGLTANRIKRATEEALAQWASVSPIDFVEIEDRGPPAGDNSYTATGSADIRFGAHLLDGATGPELAHSYLPYSETDGLAGDIHFDIGEDWSGSNGGFFLETMLHELGHSLGLDHEDDVDAIMNSFHMNRYTGLGQAELLPDDVDGIQSIYGSGNGSVTPLSDDPDGGSGGENEDPDGDPDTGTADNDIDASLDPASGLLTIEGDSLENCVCIYSNYWVTMVIGLNETTVNGHRGVYWLNRGRKSFEVDLGGGNDTVYLYRTGARDVELSLGEGDDRVAVIFSWIESLNIDAGSGDDTLWRFFSRITNSVNNGIESLF